MTSRNTVGTDKLDDTRSEDALFFLTYVSSAAQPFSKVELAHLLTKSRDNNAESGISGMLLYKDGNFMQILEGEEGAVRELYERIRSDPRHKGDIVLQQGFVKNRQFPEWSMGFHALDSPEVRAIPGYSEFLNTPLSSREFSVDPTHSQKLLLTFKKNM